MDNFNVQVNYQQNQDNWQQKLKFLTLPRIIFAALGLVLLVELVYAIKVLNPPVSTQTPVKPIATTRPNTGPGGRMSLSTAKTNIQVKDLIPVVVTVDTVGREVDGTDLIVKYDPKILQITTAGLIKGKIFNEYPVLLVDAKQGLVSISGISSLDKSFKGAGQFALINFQAKAPGRTLLTIDFKKGSTITSNLVETSTAKSILTEVDNLELEIK